MNPAVPSSRLEVLVDRIANWLIAQRKLLSLVFIAITLALGASALRVQLDAGFNKLIPLQHPFMAAFLKQCHLCRRQPRAGQRAVEGRGATSTTPNS